jgi:PadR family transcriptional regulator PadR
MDTEWFREFSRSRERRFRFGRALYPALYRLENRGWLKAEWKTTEGGREGKYYSVTKAGRRQLDAETMGWKRLCDAIALVLETAE